MFTLVRLPTPTLRFTAPRVSVGLLLRFATLGLAAAAVGFSLRFGSAVPIADEWALITDYHRNSLLDFALLRHNEHRFILSKLIWGPLTAAAGYDARAGMLLFTLLLGGASLAVMGMARRVRGHASAADLLAPALLLHWGHCFNLLMGYQVTFAVIAVLGTALLHRALTAEPGREFASGLGAGALLLALVSQGGFGLAHAPLVGAWLGYLALRLWRVGRRRDAVVVAGIPAVAAAYVVWNMATLPPKADAKPPPAAILSTIPQYLETGLGVWTREHGLWVWVGLASLAVHVAGIGFAVRAAWRNPDERPRAFGVVALIGSQLLIGLGIGLSRGGALTERYATTAAIGWVACGFAFLLYGPRIPRVGILGAAAAVALVAVNMRPGEAFGRFQRDAFRAFEADVRDGSSPTFLVGTHGQTPVLAGGDRMLPWVEYVRANGLGVGRRIAPDPAFAAVPVGVPVPFAIAAADGVRIPAPGRPVLGLRLEVEQTRHSPWEDVTLEWAAADGATKSVHAYPAIHPERHTLTFRLAGDTPTGVHLRPACPTAGWTVRRAEWLTP
jgi:hypothetical protein